MNLRNTKWKTVKNKAQEIVEHRKNYAKQQKDGTERQYNTTRPSNPELLTSMFKPNSNFKHVDMTRLHSVKRDKIEIINVIMMLYHINTYQNAIMPEIFFDDAEAVEYYSLNRLLKQDQSIENLIIGMTNVFDTKLLYDTRDTNKQDKVMIFKDEELSLSNLYKYGLYKCKSIVENSYFIKFIVIPVTIIFKNSGHATILIYTHDKLNGNHKCEYFDPNGYSENWYNISMRFIKEQLNKTIGKILECEIEFGDKFCPTKKGLDNEMKNNINKIIRFTSPQYWQKPNVQTLYRKPQKNENKAWNEISNKQGWEQTTGNQEIIRKLKENNGKKVVIYTHLNGKTYYYRYIYGAEGDPGGWCQTWSWWFIHNKLRYPELSTAELLKKLREVSWGNKKGKDIVFTTYIRNFSDWVVTKIENIFGKNCQNSFKTECFEKLDKELRKTKKILERYMKLNIRRKNIKEEPKQYFDNVLHTEAIREYIKIFNSRKITKNVFDIFRKIYKRNNFVKLKNKLKGIENNRRKKIDNLHFNNQGYIKSKSLKNEKTEVEKINANSNKSKKEIRSEMNKLINLAKVKENANAYKHKGFKFSNYVSNPIRRMHSMIPSRIPTKINMKPETYGKEYKKKINMNKIHEYWYIPREIKFKTVKYIYNNNDKEAVEKQMREAEEHLRKKNTPANMKTMEYMLYRYPLYYKTPRTRNWYKPKDKPYIFRRVPKNLELSKAVI